MTVEMARREYAAVAWALWLGQAGHIRGWRPPERWRCPACHWLGLQAEAASIRLDLAAAEASLERIRASVAW